MFLNGRGPEYAGVLLEVAGADAALDDGAAAEDAAGATADDAGMLTAEEIGTVGAFLY